MANSLERIRGKYKGGMLLGMNWLERQSRAANIILFKFIKFYCNVKPPGGAAYLDVKNFPFSMFQHTATRRRLPKDGIFTATFEVVSTHSRPKAAANVKSITIRKWPGFNTQPPEGGCLFSTLGRSFAKQFQHTAARRRLPLLSSPPSIHSIVSTHSRPKAAAKAKFGG